MHDIGVCSACSVRNEILKRIVCIVCLYVLYVLYALYVCIVCMQCMHPCSYVCIYVCTHEGNLMYCNVMQYNGRKGNGM